MTSTTATLPSATLHAHPIHPLPHWHTHRDLAVACRLSPLPPPFPSLLLPSFPPSGSCAHRQEGQQSKQGITAHRASATQTTHRAGGPRRDFGGFCVRDRAAAGDGGKPRGKGRVGGSCWVANLWFACFARRGGRALGSAVFEVSGVM